MNSRSLIQAGHKTGVVLLLSCATLAAAQNISFDKPDPAATGMSPELLARIHTRMQEFVDTGKTAGVVTLVMRHGHLASLDAVGYQDIDKKIPMTPDSIFRVQSITKPITSAGIMTLVDEGRLSLLDPVEKFVPEFHDLKVNNCGTRVGFNCELVPQVRPITVLDLMTHMSGLADGAGAGGFGAGPESPGMLDAPGGGMNPNAAAEENVHNLTESLGTQSPGIPGIPNSATPAAQLYAGISHRF